MPWKLDRNEPFDYDPEVAERGWRETADIRRSAPAGPLPPVDLSDVAILALSVARDLMKPEMRAPFERLPPELFDVGLLDRLEPLAWALWYSNTQRLSVEAAAEGSSITAATLSTALEVKARMMRVCEYVLIDHPTVGREVADIRSGTGHKDLATDLTRLANLYDLHEGLLAEMGGGHYRRSDSDDAKRLASRILYELSRGQAKAVKDAKDDTSRAFTVLRDAYDRIRRWAAATWNEDDYLPSLFSVRPYTRKSSSGDGTRGNPETGTDTGSDEDGTDTETI